MKKCYRYFCYKCANAFVASSEKARSYGCSKCKSKNLSRGVEVDCTTHRVISK